MNPPPPNTGKRLSHNDHPAQSPKPQDSEKPYDSELEYHQDLQRCGYIINTRGNFLVCTICPESRAVFSSIAIAHAKGHGLVLRKKLSQVIQNYHVLADIDGFNSTIACIKKPVAYEGIPVSDGYKCQHCSYASTTLKTVQGHIGQKHSDVVDRRSPKATRIQSLYFHPNDKVIIAVRDRLRSEEATDLMAAWEDDGSDLEDEDPMIPATRELPPWLKTLGWLKHLEGMDAAHVCGFLATVQKSTLCKSVTKAVSAYLSVAMHHLGSMLLQVRQVLKSVTT